MTFSVNTGAFTMSAPVSVDLSSGAPGTTITGALGAVTAADARGGSLRSRRQRVRDQRHCWPY